jgi:TolB-like protein
VSARVVHSQAVPARRGALLCVALLAAAGCAAHSPPPAANTSGLPRVTVAMLPLENLSGRPENGDRISRMVWTTLGENGRYQVLDPGQVDAVLVELRVRSAAAMTREQVGEISKRLGAPWILAGTVLECGAVRTPDGDVPSFSLALRLLDGGSGRVVWTGMRAHSGEDHETVFGWGRETDLDRLAQFTARELVAAIQVPAASDSARGME